MNDLGEIFARQKAYFEEGRSRDVKFRIRQLQRLKRLIKRFEEPLMRALKKDLGKSAFEAYASEIGMVYEEINYHLKHIKKWAGPEKRPTSFLNFPAKSFVYKDPLGVVLIIGPFNYPFQLLFSPLAGAVSGGNCAILKGSEHTPETTLVIQKMINEHFPCEYLYAVDPARGIGLAQELLSMPFNHIFFTGSTAVGKIVMAEAAKNLTPVTLELGGKSPCIVDKDARLAVAARRIVWGKFMNAGQTCVAPDYLCVHEKIYDDFLPLLAQEIRAQYGPDPRKSPDYPRLVHARAVERLASYLEGADIYCGGEYNIEERYFAPTIIARPPGESKVMNEEIFGPVLPVIKFGNLSDLLKEIRKKDIPLALYYFSEDSARQKDVLAHTQSGGMTINDVLLQVISCEIPFGGMGPSGLGNYHGKASFDAFTHQRAVVMRSTAMEIMTKFPPFSLKKMAALKSLMK